MGSDLCFSTYAYGWYQDFVPLYIFSILYSFPQYYAKVFLRDSLTDDNRRALELIPNRSFEIVENYSLPVLSLPATRFLMPRSEFAGFKYVYMGDVDFILYDEVGCDFLEYYLRHCESTGLPFSNAVTRDNGRWRLTGLHFMKLDEYYEKMASQIQAVLNDDPFSLSIKDSFCYDEQILYHMASKAFDLTPIMEYNRPHHGIHFGYVRDRPTGHSFARKTRLAIWKEHLPQIEPILQHSVFTKLYDLMGSRAKEMVDRVKRVLYQPIFL